MLASHSGSLGAAFQLLLLLLVHRLLLFGGRGKEPRAEHLHPELVEAIAGHQQPQVPEIVAVGRQHQHDRGEDNGVLQVPANGKREISVGERDQSGQRQQTYSAKPFSMLRSMPPSSTPPVGPRTGLAIFSITCRHVMKTINENNKGS